MSCCRQAYGDGGSVIAYGRMTGLLSDLFPGVRIARHESRDGAMGLLARDDGMYAATALYYIERPSTNAGKK